MDPRLELSVDRGSATPLGSQLADLIREALRDGRLRYGERLPSVRELAQAAGVNVNTARAVYSRLEAAGLVRSEQGRGTFVCGAPRDEAQTRRDLRRQIAQLEAALVRLPPRPLPADVPGGPARAGGAALQSSEDLVAIRDRLIETLGDLVSAPGQACGQPAAAGGQPAPAIEQPAPASRATPSLAGARIRWVGA